MTYKNFKNTNLRCLIARLVLYYILLKIKKNKLYKKYAFLHTFYNSKKEILDYTIVSIIVISIFGNNTKVYSERSEKF